MAGTHPHWGFRRRAPTHGRSASSLWPSELARLPASSFAGAQVGAFYSRAHPFTPSTRFTWWCVPRAGKAVRDSVGAPLHSCPSAKLLRKHGQTSTLCRLPLPPHHRIALMADRGWPVDPVLWQRRRCDPERVSHVQLDQLWMAGPADPACHERPVAPQPGRGLHPVPQGRWH